MMRALVGACFAGLILLVIRQQVALLDSAARCEGTGVAHEQAAAQRVAEQTEEAEQRRLLEAAQDELARLRLENQQWERLCIPSDKAAKPVQDQAGTPRDCPSGIDTMECEPHTLFLSPSEDYGELFFVRDYLTKVHGWREVQDADRAAAVLSVGEAPPVKRPCNRDFKGVRISGQFARELEVCQKHKLFTCLSERAASGLGEVVTPGKLAAAWPWLPRTYLLDEPQHVAELNSTVACDGALTTKFIVKGDAHGGRAIWMPKTSDELRALVGLSCPSNDVPTQRHFDHPPRLVQEMIESLSWSGYAIMARVFFVVMRRETTRLSAERGRWSLGIQAPFYELFMYDTASFTQYPGHIRDSAKEEDVIRRNASEVEDFIQKEKSRRGQPRQLNWVREHFMRQAGEIAAESFAASAAHWAWNVPAHDPSFDAMKAASLEPDGSYLFVAQELMIDSNMQVRLLEYTCVPADLHGLQSQFENLPWTRVFADELGMQLAHLLLQSNGQDVGESSPSYESLTRWKRLGKRGPFPHP